jgi:lipopolysaccharide transport system ATP-binding protein
MNNDVVIRAERLGKEYLIGHFARRERYLALRDVVAAKFRRIGRAAVNFASGRPMIPGDKVEELWALRDVSFEIKRGEVAGIIGPNGAGKSTLLKILSRITAPSAGRATIHGRVASLLEVGTGFHPELTGRENIFLNGAILGMSRQEVKSKFDEIVAFADIERFLDTPVKRYSSGMHVRLGFAVAAHLEPEILIVDEVLAVGDAAFQKKCLGKMREVSHQDGRTVLFVSHNLSAVESLCSRALLLQSGGLAFDGTVADAVRRHIQNMMNSPALAEDEKGRFVKSLRLLTAEGEESGVFQIGDTVIFDVELFSPRPVEQPRLGIAVYTPRGDRVATLHTEVQQRQDWSFSGRIVARALWKNIPLNTGEYRIDVSLWSRDGELETITGYGSVDIAAKDVYGTGRLPDASFQGYLIPDVSWQIATPQLSNQVESSRSTERCPKKGGPPSLVQDANF